MLIETDKFAKASTSFSIVHVSVSYTVPTFKPPEYFDFTGPTKWPEWRDRFGMFRIATKLNKEEGTVQVSSLIYAMGREANAILYKSFTLGPFVDEINPKDDFDTVMGMFDGYFVPKRNVIHERKKLTREVSCH